MKKLKLILLILSLLILSACGGKHCNKLNRDNPVCCSLSGVVEC